MKTWLVLPAYNEAENLPPLLEGISRSLTSTPMLHEVVVVDDGSQDDIASAVRTGSDGLLVRLVRHERNLGLAQALLTGLRAVLADADKDDVVVTMDSDNTHPAEILPEMIARVVDGADVVIASRFVPGGGTEGVPPLRQLLSIGASLIMRVRFRMVGVADYSSGYRAYRAALLSAAFKYYGARLIETRGFSVMAELLIKLAPFKPRVVEVPLHLRYDRKRGPSKMRLLRTVLDYLKLLGLRTQRPA